MFGELIGINTSVDPADNTRQEGSRPPCAFAIIKSLTGREGRILEHGRPEQGDRLVKERIQVSRGRAHTAAVR